MPGDDNVVRAVKIKKADGTTVTASIGLLYPLELEASRNGDAALNAGEQGTLSANVDETNTTIISVHDVAEDNYLSFDENDTSSPDSNNADSLVSLAPMATNDLHSVKTHSFRGRPMRSAAKVFRGKSKSWLRKGDL